MAKKSKATRNILIVIGVVLLLLLVFAGLNAAGILGDREEGIAVETDQVETRNITQTVTASGKIQPEIEVSISPDVPGEIVALPVKEGDWVDRGNLLVRIRPDDYKAQVEKGEASVLQSKAVLAQRRADLLNAEIEEKRQKDLFDKEAISESEYQRAQTALEVGKAAYEAADYSVKSAEAQLREFQEQLAKTAIYAPMSGTISMLDVELGERVVGTSQMAGTEMMRVAKLDQMEIEVDVNENDVVNVGLSDSSLVEIDAYPGRMFKGAVTEIANSARVSAAGTQEQVTNFPVKIRIQDRHNILVGDVLASVEDVSAEELPPTEAEIPNFRPGMSGTVDIYTRTVPDAVVVPIQAVTVRDFNALKKNDDGEKSSSEGEDTDAEESEETTDSTSEEEDALLEDLRKVVFLFDDGKAKMVEVETGISDDTHIEIKAGLTGDEAVIIGPYRAVSRLLEPDADVRLDNKRGGPRAFASSE